MWTAIKLNNTCRLFINDQKYIKENLYPVKLKYYLASSARRIYETKYFFANPFSLLDSESVMNIVCIHSQIC